MTGHSITARHPAAYARFDVLRALSPEELGGVLLEPAKSQS
jgi:hypothetical protein